MPLTIADIKHLLGDELFERLSTHATMEGVKRGDVIREALTCYLETVEKPSQHNLSIDQAVENAKSTFEQRAAVAEDIIDMISTTNGGSTVQRTSDRVKKNHMIRVTDLPPAKVAYMVNCIMAEAALNPKFRNKFK